MKTELKNRSLFYDGISAVDPSLIPSLILSGIDISKLSVTYVNDDIKKFNDLSDDQIEVNHTCSDTFDRSWKLPKEYLEINVYEYLANKLLAFSNNSNFNDYIDRLLAENAEIKTRKLEDFIRCLIYIQDIFTKNNIVHGIGRGSSCASLALFLIGIHSVDPVKYDISLEEFYHD